MTEKMNELYISVNEAIDEMNNAVASDSYKAIADAKVKMTKAFDELNAQVVKEAYNDFLAKENPMLAAIEQGYIDLYVAKVERNKLTGAESYKVDKKLNNVIDIIGFEQFANKKLFANGQWVWAVEAFIHNLTLKAIADIGTAEEKKKFIEGHQLSDAARKCDVGGDPASLTSLTKALQKIVDGIICEDNGQGLNKWKIDTRDVKYMIYLAFRRGRGKRSIAVPRDQTVVNLVVEVCNRLVTKGEYVFE